MDGSGGAFLETLQSLLSNNNDLRNAAEKRYEEAKRDQPAATVVGLFQAIGAASVDRAVREQSAVLLRQCLYKATEETSIWAKLGGSGQADVKAKLLELLVAEQVPQVRRKVADGIQSLGNQLIRIEDNERPKNAEEWPELMPLLMRTICDVGKDSGVRADCLWIVKELAMSVWQILVASADQSVQLLQGCLKDPAELVRADAAALLCHLVDNIENREDRKPFVPLIPELSLVVSQLASLEEPKHLNVVLQSLQATTEIADFFKSHIGSHILPLLSGIARSHKDSAARKYSFEALLTFLESKPKAMLKVPGYVEMALEVSMQLMTEVDEDIESWSEKHDEDNDDDEGHHTFGKEAIDRICRCVAKVEHFPQVLEILKPAITKLFQSGEWKQAVAAISSMAQIAEYVDDDPTVEQMMQVIMMQLGASHPRVRYAAWGAVAQFSEDHPEALSTSDWVGQLLPHFLRGLDDSCPRTATRSMEAFQHYGESVEREDLEPFVPDLMTRLGTKLQSGAHFKKKAITYIAVIAEQVDDAFAPYYAQLMPLLKEIIQATMSKVEERTLLGKCFECISLLGKAVGKEGFRGDAEHILQAMIQATKVPNLPANDPVQEYMMAAAERICSTMKEDFLPYVPHILPGVLEKLTLAPREYDDLKPDELDEGAEVNLTLLQEDGRVRVLVMYSSDMQELTNALDCVNTFVTELGKSFSIHVAQTAQALLPVFEFNMGEEIREQAFEIWGQLCSCAKEDGKVQVVSELVMEFLKRILPKFDADKVDLLAFKTRADGVTATLKNGGPGILTTEQVRHLCQVSMTLVSDSVQRREAKLQAQRAPPAQEADEEEGDDETKEESTREQNLRVAACEIVGAVMQHHADAFVSESFASYLDLVQRLLQSNEDDHKLALYIICDFLDHLKERVTQHWPLFVPRMLDDVLHESVEVRQAACYGLSKAAQQPAFATLAAQASAKLTRLITESRRRPKKKSEKTAQACADNALSALVEILLNHEGAVASTKAHLWGVWLAALPCQEDEEEGVRNHRILLRLFQQEKPEVVGEGGQNVSRLLSIFVDLYQTDMVNDETSRDIGQLVLRLGEAKLEALAGQYPEKQKKKLLRICKEAQRPIDP